MPYNLFQLSGTVGVNLSPTLTAINQLNGTLNKLNANFGKLESDAGRAAGRMGSAFSKFGSVLGKLASPISGVANGLRTTITGTHGLYNAISIAAATSGVTSTIKQAVYGASDLAESYSKTGQAFKGAAGVVIGESNEVARKFGVVKQEYLDAATNIGLVAKASGLTEDAAAKLSNRLTKLGLDASSFFNVPLQEALMSMRSGLVGESEPLRRFGVLLSEAAVANEALALGLVKSKKEMTEGVKVQARASIIFKQMADAQGDLARTAGGFANATRIFGGKFQNLLVDFGEKILPVAQSVLKVVSSGLDQLIAKFDTLGPYLENWSLGAARVIDRFTLVWSHAGEIVQLGWYRALVGVQDGIVGLQKFAVRAWDVIKVGAGYACDFIATSFNNLATIIQNIFRGIEKWVAGFIPSLRESLTASIAGGINDFASSGLVKQLAELPMALKGPGGIPLMVNPMAPYIQAARSFRDNFAAPPGMHTAPPVRGDLSGFAPDALFRGVQMPHWIKQLTRFDMQGALGVKTGFVDKLGNAAGLLDHAIGGGSHHARDLVDNLAKSAKSPAFGVLAKMPGVTGGMFGMLRQGLAAPGGGADDPFGWRARADELRDGLDRVLSNRALAPIFERFADKFDIARPMTPMERLKKADEAAGFRRDAQGNLVPIGPAKATPPIVRRTDAGRFLVNGQSFATEAEANAARDAIARRQREQASHRNARRMNLGGDNLVWNPRTMTFQPEGSFYDDTSPAAQAKAKALNDARDRREAEQARKQAARRAEKLAGVPKRDNVLMQFANAAADQVEKKFGLGGAQAQFARFGIGLMAGGAAGGIDVAAGVMPDASFRSRFHTNSGRRRGGIRFGNFGSPEEMADQPFHSEFIGFKELSRQIQISALSRPGGKDVQEKQLGRLDVIAEAIGSGKGVASEKSVIGQLAALNKKAFPGFAT